jgi:hypothetical protein
MLALCASACAAAPPPNTEHAAQAGWTALLAGGLAGWGDEHGGAPGAWFEAEGVGLAPEDPRKLAARPGRGVIVNGDGKTRNLFSRLTHGDVELHVEFLVPKGSNSGVYLQGRYEVQVFDSFGVAAPKHSDCGGIYQRWREADKQGFEGRPPRTNASRAPGEWQTFAIVFRAPRFGPDGSKTANARFDRVVHNGVVIHEAVEVSGPTRAAAWEDERSEGPLMLQGDHGPVAYRDLRLRRL